MTKLIVCLFCVAASLSAQLTFPGEFKYPSNPAFHEGLSFSASALVINTGTNVQVAYIIAVPKSGNITDVSFNTGTVTAFGAGDTMIVTLETVDASGNPTGTAYKGSAGFSYVGGTNGLAATTTYVATLGTQATSAVMGDMIAVRFKMSAWAAANFQLAAYKMAESASMPYTSRTTDGSTWTKTGGLPQVALKIDGSWYLGDAFLPCPYSAQVLMNNSAATYDQYGNRLSFPFNTTITGIWAAMYPTASGSTYSVVLYDANHSALATVTATGANIYTAASSKMAYFRLAAPYTLLANTTYTIAISATSASTNNTYIMAYACGAGNSAVLTALEGGAQWYVDRHTRGGAWGTDNTSRMVAGVTISSISVTTSY